MRRRPTIRRFQTRRPEASRDPFAGMSAGRAALPVCAICLILATIWAGGQGGSAGAAPGDLARGWKTFAHGDEILTLAVDPTDRKRVIAGTEGGGVVEWRLAGAALPLWPVRVASMRQFVRPNTPGLGSNTVHDVAFSPFDGSVWFATDGGVARAPADLAADGWRSWSGAAGMPGVRVFSAVAVARDGSVWAGTPGDGLTRRSAGGEWTTVEVDDVGLDDEEVRDGPGSPAVSDLLFDADGTLWVVHGRSGDSRLAASRYDPVADEWRHLLAGGPRDDPSERPRTSQLMKLALDAANGDLWIASWGRGAYRFDGETFTEYGPDHGVCDTTLWAIAANAGRAWVACGESARELGGGVAHFDGAVWTSFTTAHGLATDIVTSIALAGDVALLGTDGPSTRLPWSEVGIQPIVRQGDGIDAGTPIQSRDGGLLAPANEVTAIQFDDDGLVWVGTRGSGLIWSDASGASPWRTIGFADGLAGDTITDIAMDARRIWVTATTTRLEDGRYVDGGVSAIDRADPSAPPITIQPAPDDRPNGQVSSVAVLPDGRIALGMGAAAGSPGRDPHDGRGLAIHDVESGSWEYFDHAWTSGGLAGNTVMDLAVAGDELWAATSYFRDATRELQPVGGGVSAWNGETWSVWGAGDEGFTAYAEDLIRGDVRSVHAAPDGAVWAGAWHADEGSLIGLWPFVDAMVQRFDGARWHAERFVGQGWVSDIAVDHAGRVWAATTRGHRQEAWPSRGVRGEDAEGYDSVEGGLRVLDDTGWSALHEGNSGLGARALTALAIDPATGDLWVGSESGGILVRDAEGVDPTPAPRPTLDASTILSTLYLPNVSR